VSDSRAESWYEAQLTDPEFLAAYLREVTQMHREAIATSNPFLARWCMRERARLDRWCMREPLDSSGSTR